MMRFLILRILTHSELGMFHEYRRQGKEGSKQRAVNFDWDVVDRVFPAAKDHDRVEMDLLYDTDHGVRKARHWLKRQEKNWRLEGNCPKDKCYVFVDPGCLFAMQVDAGTTPAAGAWAVFPADHHVTKVILADGESRKLTSSAMIALHDEEGERTWRILSEARPDLFMGPKKAETVPSVVPIGSPGLELPPDPSRLVKILASVGHTMPSAVADLVDNAISAHATDISIAFGRPDGGHGRWMSIADNGDGMDEAKLAEAMRIGSNADYEPNSLGKYGYGLKGASWSQAKVFTVVTKQKSGRPHHLTWDVDDMQGWRAKCNPLEEWEKKATTLDSQGTVVLWKSMRPPRHIPSTRGLDPYSTEVMLLERHLALVFHRFLEGKALGRKPIAISINGKRVAPNNPFGNPLTSHYDLKTIRVPTENGDGFVQVQAYLLPSEAEISDYYKPEGNEAVREALDKIGLYGKRNDSQGLFIFRHDRLIKWGGWHQMWETNDEKTKLARVMVNFDSILDDAFSINISKQIVHLPQQLQAEIKTLADVARKDSRKKYTREARLPLTSTQQSPGSGVVGGSIVAGTSTLAAPEPSSLPTTATSTNPLPMRPTLPPRVGIKEVKTEKFAWKVTQGITGGFDLQVSEVNPALSNLVKQIRGDTQAIAYLAAFLRGLDEAGVQTMLLPDKAA